MYNPDYHHRRSIRLPDYDYSGMGQYFITICSQNMVYLFGRVENGGMILNPAGRMAQKWWSKLPNKFLTIRLGVFVVMPNHIHGIVEIIDDVGADLCVCPNQQGRHRGLPIPPGLPLRRSQQLIPRVVQWFKTMSTNEYIKNVKQNNWSPFDQRLWQRNYYEHIIRNQIEYQKISEYIINNPLNWDEDRNSIKKIG
ncbi:MAG: transposase [Patescibacteria group bacterium]